MATRLKPPIRRDFYTMSEAAKILRISRPTLYRRIKDGSLAVVQLGGRRLVAQTELDRISATGTQSPPRNARTAGDIRADIIVSTYDPDALIAARRLLEKSASEGAAQ